MTDLHEFIQQQAAGGLKVKPDEQRKFLETFEERVIVDATLEEINNPLLKEYFSHILTAIKADFQPVLVKISPMMTTKDQLFYLKTAQDLGCESTIVSEDCQSPLGLVIHTDHAVEIEDKDMMTRYAPLLLPAEEKATQKTKKLSFWKKLFQ
ncbi:DUF1694 domain-containing protein [Streptococcus himalayensis]|uniref:DUF1694 domain-containing protein n=1 Tax=Streptococcus himalayensis TaxID=1888195 RepID=A0A917EG22_9STRE|nr:DUF1694 domain-containing protein [Streptococcus himalayensis]GGE29314.1 hypothetical protein GCM10011510_08290 [Streptococcus himalayensis]